MPFSRQQIIDLINEYKRYECLYNHKVNSYHSSDAKTKAWNEIARKFGVPVDEVRKKMRNLRQAYVAEKKKVDQSKRSGTGSSEDIYTPNLYYFSDLSFLDSAIILRRTSDSFKNEPTSLEVENEYTIEQPNTDQLYAENVTSISLDTSQDSMDLCGAKRKRINTTDPSKGIYDNAIKNAFEVGKSQENDTISLFAKSIASQLRDLSIVIRSRTMMKLQEVISEATIEALAPTKASIMSYNSNIEYLSSTCKKTRIRDTVDESLSSITSDLSNTNDVNANENDSFISTSFSQNQKRIPSHTQNIQRNTVLPASSGFLKNQHQNAATDRWKRIFSELIFCELDRYDYREAQILKNQLIMVCLDFRPAQEIHSEIVDASPINTIRSFGNDMDANENDCGIQSAISKNRQRIPNQNQAIGMGKWKIVFSEFICCELDRYEYRDAQILKYQLNMVCLNYQPTDSTEHCEDVDTSQIKIENDGF